MVNRESIREKLKSKLNFCKQTRKSVVSKINNVEKQDKRKDGSIYDNETSKNRKNRRKNCRKEVTRYNGGNQEINLNPEQQQEFFANMMKQQQQVKNNPETDVEEYKPPNDMLLNNIEQHQLKELNELIDLKNELTNKNGDLLINHQQSDRIVEIINNIKETETYQKYANENIDLVEHDSKTDVIIETTNDAADIINDIQDENPIIETSNTNIDIINDIDQISTNIE